MSEDRIPMTREGYDKLKTELDHMQGVQMIEITQRVATAREMGDLSENAEYHAAREDQGMLQAKIHEKRDQLNRAQIIDPAKIAADGVVVFGAKVTVRDLDYDDDEQFTLVGPGQEDPDNNKILTSSPIAQGLMGKKVGDRVEIPVPKGTLRFEVRAIAFG